MIAVLPASEGSVAGAQAGLGQTIDGLAEQNSYVEPAYLPNLSARYRLVSAWSIGVSVSAPWGLSTTYDRAWIGRYHGHETKLMTVNVMPTVAYEPSSDFTLAAALQVQYAKGRLSNAIDVGTIGAVLSVPGALPAQQDGYGAFEAQDWGLGYMLGAQWAVSEGLKVGASFRSEIEHRMTGPVAFLPGGSATGTALTVAGLLLDTRGATDLTTPAVVSLGATMDVMPNWTLAGEIAFTDWSVFKELRVEFANALQPDEVTVFDWHDSWFGAIGATYASEDDWALRFGVAYDQSPAGAARNARIPDADRCWFALGADFGLTERTKLTLSVAHLFVPEESINLSTASASNVFRGDFSGVTDAEATVIGVGLTLR